MEKKRLGEGRCPSRRGPGTQQQALRPRHILRPENGNGTVFVSPRVRTERHSHHGTRRFEGGKGYMR